MNTIQLFLLFAFLGGKLYAGLEWMDQDKPIGVYYNAHLRGLFEKEKNRIIEDQIEQSFKTIYQTVLHLAAIGETQLYFTILCCDTLFEIDSQYFNNKKVLNCNLGGNLGSPPYHMMVKGWQDDKIQVIVDKIKRAFPDSHFIKLVDEDIEYKRRAKQCDYYIISW